jgi:hypothetical protein
MEHFGLGLSDEPGREWKDLLACGDTGPFSLDVRSSLQEMPCLSQLRNGPKDVTREFPAIRP